MPVWKKFLAACLLVFSATLFSCETKVVGELKVKHQQTEMLENSTIGKPAAPKLIGDTSVLTPSCGNRVGFIMPVIVDTIETQGDVQVDIAPPIVEMGIIEEVPVLRIDTPVTNNLLFKKGELKLIEKDSAKAGTDSCNKQVFY